MQKRAKLILTFIILVVIIATLYAFTNWFSIVTGYAVGQGENVKLARCLDDRNTELYSSDYCADCQKQKAELGYSYRIIQIVDCGEEKELCPNIREMPAWCIDGKIYYGFKTLDEL